MKRILVLLAVLLVYTRLCAVAKSQRDVLTTATNWIDSQTNNTNTVTNFTTINNVKNVPMVYKIDFSPDGYVVMAADDRSYPILGYSTTGSITNQNIPALNDMLSGYRDEIVAIIAAKCSNTVTSAAWAAINSKSRSTRSEVILPFEATWGQGSPYNNYCPWFNNQRSVVGSVATAMSQITNYFKAWDYQFPTDVAYTSTKDNNTANIFTDAATLNFPNRATLNSYMATVTNKYNSNTAIDNNDRAAICLANGILLHTNYSPSSSEAITIADGSRAYGELGYHNSIANKSSYTETQWESMIISDLNDGHPIHYKGSGSDGNSFILCGYSNDTTPMTFRFNWGWTGASDGWFVLSNLNPNGYSYTQTQGMLYQLYPTATVDQTVALGGTTFTGTAQLILIDNQGSQQSFNSNSAGVFHLTGIKPGIYDTIIKHSSDNYEWYQRYGVSFHYGVNRFDNTAVTLPYNLDKLITVPTDYADIQDAVNRIQDGGIVRILNGTYSVNGLNWSYKHIQLRGYSAVINNNGGWQSAIELTWAGINNQDIIQNITFSYCHLNGYAHGPALSLMNGASPRIDRCNFENNLLSHSYSMEYPTFAGVGGAVFVQGGSNQTQSPIFNYCNFTNNCAMSTSGGGAIALYGRASFYSCNFTGNVTDQYLEIDPPPSKNAAGAVLIFTQTKTGDVTFDNCQFTNNFGREEANDVYVINCDNLNQVRFSYCTFNGANSNYVPSIKILTDTGTYGPQAASILMDNNRFETMKTGAIYFNDYAGKIAFKFIKNILRDIAIDIQPSGYGVFLKYHGGAPSNPNYFVFNNNTMVDINGKGLVLYQGACYKIKSCIFLNCSENAINWHDGERPYYTVSVDIQNCFFDASHQNTFVDYTGDTTYHLYTTGLQFAVIPGLDTNLTPIWNSSIKSVCIDNGAIDSDGDGINWYSDEDDRDIDGSQADIGAKTLVDGHVHSVHKMVSNEVKYISFPGVISYPNHTSENTFQYVFDTFRGNGLCNNSVNQILSKVDWIYNGDKGSYSPTSNYPSHHVCSQNGYKVKLRTDLPVFEKDIEYTGYRPGAAMNSGMYLSNLNRYTTQHYILPPVTTDTTTCKIDPDTGVLYRKTYLGYYLAGSLLPLEALSPIRSKIIAIIAEDWALNRVPVTNYQYQPGDQPEDAYTTQWVGTSNIPINPGDMVEVHYIDTAAVEFNLGGDNQNPPYTKVAYRNMPTNFEYEEDFDYLPVNVSLDLDSYNESNIPAEIAVYVDDICKGAAVVEGDSVQINAYVLNDPSIALEDIELRTYSPNRAIGEQSIEYARYSQQTGKQESKKVKVGELTSYLSLNVRGDSNNSVIPATVALKNYPNPFNPNTTIQYALNKDGEAKLEIFNVKGQLVKTLLNGDVMKGTHSILWDGNDNAGHSVASGVYFARLKVTGQTLTQKMLLLK